MMGDKSESEFIRAEYVDGKFREHDRKHKADMEGVKKTFEHAAGKHRELRGEVDQMKNSIVALQADVKSLREMMVMYFQKGTCEKEESAADTAVDKPLVEEWVNNRKVLDMVRCEYGVTAKYGEITLALEWAGYITAVRGHTEKSGTFSIYSLTGDGYKLGYLRTNSGGIQIKRDHISEIANLVEDYHDFLRNARRGK